MEKVLKVNVYLNDLKDYAGMSGVFRPLRPGTRRARSPPPAHHGNSLVSRHRASRFAAGGRGWE